MRNFKEALIREKQLDQVFCNLCGKEIKKNRFGEFEDYLHIEKVWNYDSKKDGTKTEFDLCEDCFDQFAEQFQIPLL